MPVLPPKIIGVGVNYRAHAAEMGKAIPESPLLFLKPTTAALGPLSPIFLPRESEDVHHEAELAVVIKKRARRIRPEEAPAHILGYTCFNDVTARDIQRTESQYTRSKGFDTFAPFGPVIETELDPMSLTIRGLLNGDLKQEGHTSDMVVDVYALVAFVSQGMTLLPGDVLTTGTPPGVGPLCDGDEFEVVIDGIGSLKNPVRTEE
jgi:2-keto-4-pentenoate hydratase/2-oxohepta-3-ene-1,7-dioic acid hydratase in catechol pathway